MTVGRVVVVGPHPPCPSVAARLCARLGAEHARAGARVLGVDRLPSAAGRTVPLRGLAGAAAVAWLALGADRLELVLVPGLVQRAGARSPEHRLIAAAWGVALGIPRSTRIHVLDPVDALQVGLRPGATAPPGLEIIQHVPRIDPGPVVIGADGPAGGDPWAAWADAVTRRAALDRRAGLSLRLPTPPPPFRSRNQRVVDHLRDSYGQPGEVAVQAILRTKRLARAALAAARRRRGSA